MANLFYKVVNETCNLSCLLESNSILVYQLYEFVRDTPTTLVNYPQIMIMIICPPAVKMIEGDSEEDYSR